MASEDKRVTVDEADETDDLDELLDEALDDYSSSQSTKLPPSGSSTTTFPSLNISPDKSRDQADLPSQLDDEYVKLLTADMEDFVKEFDENELSIAMQGLMKNFGEVDEDNLNGTDFDNTGRSTVESNGTSFQDKINQTMNKLQNSSEQLDAEIIDGSNDQIMEMMKQIENMANLSGFAENDFEEMFGSGGMEKMLESMMEALATKDYLYEPMKEFAQKMSSLHPFTIVMAVLILLSTQNGSRITKARYRRRITRATKNNRNILIKSSRNMTRQISTETMSNKIKPL
ncbi:hypothetical protein RirG_178570 [Rhizophagus irregularis DAOM 197198w]|uniref:Uncharacterized protein n=1 Tax=Rhizophagus irregularis (strain DAOM 197198w) TaxID=1432141 RepID=A0A015ITN6_RHIIW|nr:hypothetical protein RirG_178570 [Rhizophagus irregularis DAOM 197198w]